MIHLRRTIILAVSLLIFSNLSCLAQDNAGRGSIAGQVFDEAGDHIPGAHVQLNDEQATITDESGRFAFQRLRPGAYTLRVSFIGFEAVQKSIQLDQGQALTEDFIIKEEAVNLSEVAVTGKSEASALRESVASVAVLEVKGLYAQSTNTSDIMKQIAGVNVRQAGGFGSDADIYINGMSGKQIKLFIDGIPISYFGSGLNLNVLPVNLMKQIEVYKGVVPVHLGADALGGAINIISRKEFSNYLDASYSFGSFNSHKVNLNGQLVNQEKKFLAGINSFFNYSDNNYKVDIEIPNEFGNPEPATVQRFHDRFSNYLLSMYAGVFDRSFADQLIFSARYSGLEDEIQHNAIMAQPYGEVAYDESTLGFSIEYEKKNILPNTDLKWYGGLNYTNGNFIDTTLNAYTWDGEVYRRRTDGGEISASRNLLALNSRNAVSRFNVHYTPWEKGQITLNIFSSWFRRTGEDPIAAEFYGQDYYTYPTVLTKNATGLSYQHSFGEALESYTAVKHFAYSADGYAIQNLEFQPNSQTLAKMGYSQSFRYQVSEQILTKASYEYATRLPDEYELFGDFTLIRPNPFLEPEQSHNINLGGQLNAKKVDVDLNLFYRLTENIIWLRTSQFFAQYQNLLKAAVKGLDVEVRYKPRPFIHIKANATFQDIRNRSPRNVTGTVDDRYFDARLPNIPYLFGNAEIRYQKKGFMGLNNRLSAWWSAAYVHDFYLFWAVDGNRDLKNAIPAQFIQNVGISYAFDDNRFAVTIESQNIFNQKAFDNFSVQRPGRAFTITLRTYIK